MKETEKPRIILGIDPGTNLLGYGIIETLGNGMALKGTGVVRLDKYSDHGKKLFHIYEKIAGLIDGFQITEVAIEAPFYGKNVQSMLKLGRAQGVAIAAAISRNLEVYEYVPRKIKQSITGNGNASKEQVSAMLQSLLVFDQLPESLDATDGLAAAVCHFFQFSPRSFGQTGSKTSKGKPGNWKQFLSENPDRLKK
ncbi:MAG: crossover junction endodeoxyribonuclease RuvC [Bacteroidetes bacterium]|nr:crossover junction endodeoxyribonuclease RuvC [Bacteroidota bacterium]